ncbi:MAG: tyrosine--tRNA ligase [Phycisphaerae bacterium]|nr:tyrosine--tRNA ligase [Phycisphaerae bacterium]
MAGTDVLALLKERDMLYQATDEAATRVAFESGRVSCYVGFDPTARSLHVGSLLPILVLAHVQRAGHRAVALVGGATGMVGDPSGRSSERSLLSDADVRGNAEAIRAQLARFLRFDGDNPAAMVNNADWIGPMSVIDWLRDVGKHFTVNSMLAKESVRSRLEDREHGISYTEFSYMLMQAYDFYWLFEHEGCLVQGGGSDQWGNITAGIDLIRRKTGKEAHGFTWPLVTSSAGEKFGKSAGNAVWLDAGLTTPYQFYQYFVRAEDVDVGKYLKFFTFLPVAEIASIMDEHARDPGKRHAQRVLAREVTRIVHGEAAAAEAESASAALFTRGGGGAAEKLKTLGDTVPTKPISRAGWAEGPVSAVNLVAMAGVVASKGEARRLIDQKGLSINEEVVTSPQHPVGLDRFIDGVLLVRTGKNNYTRIVLRD